LQYILSVGAGQFNVINRSIPLDKALEDPNLKSTDRDKLIWIQQVRDYAKNELGMNVKASYSYYYDTDGGPAVYNLSASSKDALKPVVWTFPVLGKIQYLGYFKLDEAEAKAQQLANQGCDYVIYGAIAYSTLGYFRDPIYSSILTLDKDQLADTVIHELTHNTVYNFGNSEFNESVANFVGKMGARDFIRSTLGEDSELLAQIDLREEDDAHVTSFLNELYDELNNFYARPDLTSEQKIEQREQIFSAARERFQKEVLPLLHAPDSYSRTAEIPSNNAWVLLNHRYNKNMDIFEKVYNACSQDLRATIDVFRKAGKAGDGYQFLEKWLNQSSVK